MISRLATQPGEAEGLLKHLDRLLKESVANFNPYHDEKGLFTSAEAESARLVYRAWQGGFTYKPIGGKPAAEGFVVSLSRSAGWEHPVTEDEFKAHGRKIVQDYLKEVRDAVKQKQLGPKAHIGAWRDYKTNRIVLDVNELYKGEKEAKYVGYSRQQDAIFDLKTGEVIDLRGWHPTANYRGGDGRRIGEVGRGNREVSNRDVSEEARDPQGKWTIGGGTVPIHTDDVNEALKALAAGRHVILDQPRQVSTLLEKMREMVEDAVAKGEKAPTYNLCNVSVKGTNLFCAESKGIPRIKMPQLKGVPTKGSMIDKEEELYPKDEKGKVNLAPDFVADLREHGVTVIDDKEDASYLRASQDELDGGRVARMYHQLGEHDVTDPIVVSRDNYIVDGHHHWAARVAKELEKGKPLKIKVLRVDMGIIDLLKRANEFSEKMQMPHISVSRNVLRNVRERGLKILEVPDIRQRDHYSCGAAAAMAVGKYFGVGPKSLTEWKHELGTVIEESTHPSAIVKYFLKLGLDVDAREGMTLDDLKIYIDEGMPIICPVQDYGPFVPAKAKFAYGHYLTVIGVAGGYVFCQDSSEDNVIADSGSVQKPGRVMIDQNDWMDLWHDKDVEGNKFIQYGIAVRGRTLNYAEDQPRDERGRFEGEGETRSVMAKGYSGVQEEVLINPTRTMIEHWINTTEGNYLKGYVTHKGEVAIFDNVDHYWVALATGDVPRDYIARRFFLHKNKDGSIDASFSSGDKQEFNREESHRAIQAWAKKKGFKVVTLNYSPDQPRDEGGRWTSGDSYGRIGTQGTTGAGIPAGAGIARELGQSVGDHFARRDAATIGPLTDKWLTEQTAHGEFTKAFADRFRTALKDAAPAVREWFEERRRTGYPVVVERDLSKEPDNIKRMFANAQAITVNNYRIEYAKDPKGLGGKINTDNLTHELTHTAMRELLIKAPLEINEVKRETGRVGENLLKMAFMRHWNTKIRPDSEEEYKTWWLLRNVRRMAASVKRYVRAGKSDVTGALELDMMMPPQDFKKLGKYSEWGDTSDAGNQWHVLAVYQALCKKYNVTIDPVYDEEMVTYRSGKDRRFAERLFSKLLSKRVANYSETQPRDEKGRFEDAGGETLSRSIMVKGPGGPSEVLINPTRAQLGSWLKHLVNPHAPFGMSLTGYLSDRNDIAVFDPSEVFHGRVAPALGDSHDPSIYRKFLIGREADGIHVYFYGQEDKTKAAHRTIRAWAERKGFTVNVLATNAGADDVRKFQRDLKKQLDGLLLGEDNQQAWNNLIQSGFKKGVMRSYDDFKHEHPDIEEQSLPEEQKTIFRRGGRARFIRDALQSDSGSNKANLLSKQAFGEVKSVAREMSNRMSRVITQGLLHGKSAAQVRRELGEEVERGAKRTRLISRTELVKAHAEGQLHAFRRLGVRQLATQVEWVTAGDDDVCPQCEEMEGSVYDIDDADGMIPLHPNCRCAWVPVREKT
jgi:SPP1 gp7 family putative phage head morphogenesis protein